MLACARRAGLCFGTSIRCRDRIATEHSHRFSRSFFGLNQADRPTEKKKKSTNITKNTYIKWQYETSDHTSTLANTVAVCKHDVLHVYWRLRSAHGVPINRRCSTFAQYPKSEIVFTYVRLHSVRDGGRVLRLLFLANNNNDTRSTCAMNNIVLGYIVTQLSMLTTKFPSVSTEHHFSIDSH